MTETDSTTSSKAPTSHGPSIWRRLRFLPLALLFAAVAITTLLRVQNRPATSVHFIHSIKITKPSSMTIDPSSIIMSDNEQDFYVIITLKNGKTVRLATQENMLIGNGLTWNLTAPLPLENITELSLWDDDPISDDHLDRVSMDGESLSAQGQHYHFDLIEDQTGVPDPPDPRIIWSIISGSGVLALLAAVFFVRDQALNEVPHDG